MKLTIIPCDFFVSVDGDGSHTPLNLSNCGIPENVHALQWKDTVGWIEFIENLDGTKPQNEIIEILPIWANYCVTVWESWIAPELTQSAEIYQPVTTGTQTA